MGAAISSQIGRQTTIARSMLLIGGCELSLERNPVAQIEQVTVDESSGALSVEETKHEEGEGQLLVPVRSPTVHRFGDKMLVIGGCRGPKDHIKDVQVYDPAFTGQSPW